MFKVGVITCSDRGFSGDREDLSGKLIVEILEKSGYKIAKYIIVPDVRKTIRNELIEMADNLKVDLILTSGGTGFSPRDVTPEATMDAIDKKANGIAEAMRSFSLSITKRAMLSRAVSGIRGDTLIVNMPGSPKAVDESLNYILDSLHHGLEILTDTTDDCGRK